MTSTVTMIIHGTFAKHAEWWKLGSTDQPTFADRLESELTRCGLQGTVWNPTLRKNFDYSAFSWSGENRHRDRLAGARGLSSSINQLAEEVKATPTEPLTVNFVAHSHGGNVVLEALRRLKPNAQVGRIALLGTPLVTVKPAFRIARFFFAMSLLTIFFFGLMALVFELGNLLLTGHFFGLEQFTAIKDNLMRETLTGVFVLLIALLCVIAYAWMFWLIGNVLDVTWRVICRLFQPLAWLRRKASSLVYGPSLRNLTTILRGQPILLLTTDNDEAELLLEVGSAPERLYLEYVETKFSRLQRLLEIIFLRPWVLGVFLKAVEMFLEVFSLGVSVWKSLIHDFEVASPAAHPHYPPDVLVREEIDISPKAVVAMGKVESGVVPPQGTIAEYVTRRSVRLSLQEVIDELKGQIHLRHSAYYENDKVIARVAEFLTSGEVRPTGTTRPASIRPKAQFWEGLLIANVGLSAIYVWIAHPVSADFFLSAMSILLASYVVQFASLGIGLGFYYAVRRQMPVRLWRWFWILWSIFWLLVLISAVKLRIAP